MSLIDLGTLMARICHEAKLSMHLNPGCGIGPLQGRAHTSNLEDLVWGRGVVPYFSRKALEALAGEGIRIPATPFRVKCGRKGVDTHASLNLSPRFMLTGYSRNRMKLTACEGCNCCTWVPSVPRDQIKPSWREVRKDLWPKGEHLVAVGDYLEVIVSEEFMDVVRKLGLTGFEFSEFGSLVKGERSSGPGPVSGKRKQKSVPVSARATKDVLATIFPGPKDRTLVREKAREIAKLLGSKAASTSRHVIGEPVGSYKVAMNMPEMWCSVTVGENSFVFSARAKPRRPEPDLYFLSIKRPEPCMFAVKVNALMSDALGVDVYKMEFVDEAVVHRQLTGGPSWNLLRALDFSRIDKMNLNPAQCTVVGVFDTPESCAVMVRALRDFISLALQEAIERRQPV